MDFFSNILQKITPASTFSYTKPAPPVIAGVPEEYVPTVIKASQHTGYPTSTIVNHFNSENGGNWDPKLKGRANPRDLGITQLNPSAIQTITGAGGKTNYFKQNFDHDFDPNSGHDQILAAAVYLNWLKQYGLPEAGRKNPTPKDVFTSYNTGAKGYLDPTKAGQVRTYQALQARNGNNF